jgi:hypothetical protein
MKNKTFSIKRLPATASTILLLFLLESCKKEILNSGVTKEFTLQSAANGATYK